MGNRNHVDSFRAIHIYTIVLFLLMISITGWSQIHPYWGIQSGYSHQNFSNVGGLPVDVFAGTKIRNKFSIELGFMLLTAKGNNLIETDRRRPYIISHPDFPPNFIFGGRFQGSSGSVKTDQANQFSSFLKIGYDFQVSKNQTISLMGGLHVTRVRMNIIYEIVAADLSVPYIQPEAEFALIPIPLYHNFLAYSFRVNVPYSYRVNDKLSLRLDPYYAHMRGWRGFWGGHTGIVVDM